jgi:hypothetical protein
VPVERGFTTVKDDAVIDEGPNSVRLAACGDGNALLVQANGDLLLAASEDDLRVAAPGADRLRPAVGGPTVFGGSGSDVLTAAAPFSPPTRPQSPPASMARAVTTGSLLRPRQRRPWLPPL